MKFYWRKELLSSGERFWIYNPETYLIATAINEIQAERIVTALNAHMERFEQALAKAGVKS